MAVLPLYLIAIPFRRSFAAAIWFVEALKGYRERGRYAACAANQPGGTRAVVSHTLSAEGAAPPIIRVKAAPDLVNPQCRPALCYRQQRGNNQWDGFPKN